MARWTLVASILGSSMAFIDGSVVNVALPSIQHDLGGGLATQQWVVDAYLLTLGSLILVGGSLGDIFGESRVFAIGVASFAGASVLCAVAPDAPALIVFRGIQGMAGALLAPASLAMITATFTGTARGNAIGQWTSWTGISFIVGPTLGGWLVDVSTLAGHLPHQPADRGRHAAHPDAARRDAPGAAGGPASRRRRARSCARPGWASSSPGFIEQPRLGWGDPLILGAFVGGARAASARSSPTSCGRRCRCSRSGSSGCATSRSRTSRRSRSTAGSPALTTFLTLYLIEFAGFSALHAGLSLLPVTFVMFFLSPRMGRLSMQHGPRLFMSLGPILAGVAVLAYTRLPQDLRLLGRHPPRAARLLGRAVR